MPIQPYLSVQRGNVRVSKLTVINAILLSPKMAVNGGPCRYVSASGTRFTPECIVGPTQAFLTVCLCASGPSHDPRIR